MIRSFNRACGSLVGGVAAIELIEARSVALPWFDSSMTRCSMPQIIGDADWVKVECLASSGSYIETSTLINGMCEVHHALRFELPPREDTSAFVHSLAEATRLGGIVARVTLNTGLQLLIGVSPTLGYEQPLRLAPPRLNIEAERDERPTEYIMLESCTESCAPVITN